MRDFCHRLDALTKNPSDPQQQAARKALRGTGSFNVSQLEKEVKEIKELIDKTSQLENEVTGIKDILKNVEDSLAKLP